MEAVGDLVLGRAERDPGDERGDQAVAEGGVGEPVGRDAEADGEDALVAGRDPTRRGVAVDTAADDAHDDADQRAERGFAQQLRRLGAGVAARRRQDQEEQDERQRQPVVQPRFEVQRVANALRHPLRGHHGRGDHRIGGREDGGEQEGLGHRQRREQDDAEQRQDRQGERHREHDRARRWPPVQAEQLALDDQAVGEQREDQGQLDQVDDVGIADLDVHDVRRGEGDARAPTERTETESTVPRITPESPAATASSRPKISSDSPKPRSIGTGYAAGWIRRRRRRARARAAGRARPAAPRPERRSWPPPCGGCCRRSTC